MSLNYEQYNCTRPDAPWVVLIHGLFGNLDNLSLLRKYLQPNFNLLSIDLPDHGLSSWTEGFSLHEASSALYDLIISKGVNQVSLVGHSLGGKLAMMTALNYPNFISRLVVIDIAPVEYQPNHESVFAGLKNVTLELVSNRKSADTMLATHIKEPSVRSFLLKSLYQSDNGHWNWRFNLAGLERNYANISSFDVSQGARFNGETTFVKGGNSPYILPEHQSSILRFFPQARAKVVTGTGHWLHAEKPSVVNGIVERALP